LETGSGQGAAASHAQDTEPNLKESHPSTRSEDPHVTTAPSQEASPDDAHEQITEEAHLEQVDAHGGSEPKSFEQSDFAWGTMLTPTNTIPASLQVSVRNLDKQVRIGDVVDLFSQIGQVRGAKIFFYFATAVNKTSGQTPFKMKKAVVEFAEEASVPAAISRLDGTSFKGKKISVAKRVAKCVCLPWFLNHAQSAV
jgi:hypothetical protein